MGFEVVSTVYHNEHFHKVLNHCVIGCVILSPFYKEHTEMSAHSV